MALSLLSIIILAVAVAAIIFWRGYGLLFIGAVVLIGLITSGLYSVKSSSVSVNVQRDISEPVDIGSDGAKTHTHPVNRPVSGFTPQIGLMGLPVLVLFLLGFIFGPKVLMKKFNKGQDHSFNWGIAGVVTLVILVGAGVVFRVHYSQNMEGPQARAEQMQRQEVIQRMERQERETIMAAARLANQNATVEAGEEIPAIWREGIEDQFEADTYPSVRAAVRALAVRAMEKLKDFDDNEEDIGTVWFFASDQIKEDVYKEAGGYLDSKYPASNIQIIQPGRHEGKKGAFLDFIQTRYELRNKKLEGTIQVNLRYKDNSFSYIQNYTLKKWVDNLDDFLNQNPQGQYIIAYSQSSCTTRQQAGREAMSQATKLAFNKMTVEGRISFDISNMTVHPKDMQNLIADRFTQALDGSQGKIWREALLLDFSPGRYDHAVSQINRKNSAIKTAMRQDWASMIFSAVALTALICGIYFVLNMATRGYYTWVLRIILGIVALGGMLALLIA